MKGNEGSVTQETESDKALRGEKEQNLLQWSKHMTHVEFNRVKYTTVLGT